MGWKGEGFGLGKSQQGITKPIEIDSNAYRFGLGCRVYDDYDDVDDNVLEKKMTAKQNEQMDVDDTAQNEPNQKMDGNGDAFPTNVETKKSLKKQLNNNNNNNRKNVSAVTTRMDCYDIDEDEAVVVSKGPPKRPSRSERNQQQKQNQQQAKRNWQTKSLMCNNIRTILINYANSEAENDLVFEKSLSSDDRKLVHQEAHKLDLKTRSQGVEPNRFIVISKKRSSQEIIEAVLRNGGQSSKFQLISTGQQPSQSKPE